MSGAKVTLSDAEIGLFQNAELILTKNHILEQTRRLLEHLQAQMQDETALLDQGEGVFAIPPKISRGENYRGLPYLVLDYPRQFGVADTFAIRSFFWWGHFFSSTLQLSGTYSQMLGPRLEAAYELLARHHYFLHTGTDPWAHHFEAGNYQPIRELSQQTFSDLLQRQAPIKIAAKWPLDQWPFAANHLFESWKFLLQITLA